MKYELDQTIYYLRDNKVHGAPVLARMHVENLKEEWDATAEQARLFKPFGPAGTWYATCHGVVAEQDAFPTKVQLAASLVDM